jgi:hypothetical protein
MHENQTPAASRQAADDAPLTEVIAICVSIYTIGVPFSALALMLAEFRAQIGVGAHGITRVTAA